MENRSAARQVLKVGFASKDDEWSGSGKWLHVPARSVISGPCASGFDEQYSAD
jgi:hypothetical protein